MSEALRINKIEVACELAHDRTIHELKLDPYIDVYKIYVDAHASVTNYTAWFQDHFNNWYDYYLTKLEELGQ